MGFYATVTDVESYIEGGTGLDAPTVERHIARAERDLDRAAGPRSVHADGRKFDPASLSTIQKSGLTRATSAQVEYRLAKGEQFFIEARLPLSGPDFSTEVPEPSIGPKVRQELHAVGLLRVTGIAI